jgi:hypothetical protein
MAFEAHPGLLTPSLSFPALTTTTTPASTAALTCWASKSPSQWPPKLPPPKLRLIT